MKRKTGAATVIFTVFVQAVAAQSVADRFSSLTEDLLIGTLVIGGVIAVIYFLLQHSGGGGNGNGNGGNGDHREWFKRILKEVNNTQKLVKNNKGHLVDIDDKLDENFSELFDNIAALDEKIGNIPAKTREELEDELKHIREIKKGLIIVKEILEDEPGLDHVLKKVNENLAKAEDIEKSLGKAHEKLDKILEKVKKILKKIDNLPGPGPGPGGSKIRKIRTATEDKFQSPVSAIAYFVEKEHKDSQYQIRKYWPDYLSTPAQTLIDMKDDLIEWGEEIGGNPEKIKEEIEKLEVFMEDYNGEGRKILEEAVSVLKKEAEQRSDIDMDNLSGSHPNFAELAENYEDGKYVDQVQEVDHYLQTYVLDALDFLAEVEKRMREYYKDKED